MAKPRPLLPLGRVREALDYNPETGIFTWKVRPAIRVVIGNEAGTIRPDGYRCIGLDGQHMPAARLAFYMMTGREPEGVMDHINGDRLDNRWVNLRDVSQAVNIQAARLDKRGKSSRFRGVSRVLPNARARKDARWQACITASGKTYHLGFYAEERDAAAAYEEARARLHGDALPAERSVA